MKTFSRFRYKFTPLVWVLLILVLLISIIGVGFSIYNIDFKLKSNYEDDLFTSIIVLIINLFLLVFTFSVIAFSRYSFKKQTLYCNFGIISTKYKVSDIVQLTHFKLSNTLVAYFIDQKYTVIVISPEKYEHFIKQAKSINPNIIFEKQNTND